MNNDFNHDNVNCNHDDDKSQRQSWWWWSLSSSSSWSAWSWLRWLMIVIMTKKIHRLYFTGASWKQCGQRIQAQGGGCWNRWLKWSKWWWWWKIWWWIKWSSSLSPFFSDAGAIIFENETILEFSRQFLSISISTNKAVYDGGQDIRSLSSSTLSMLWPIWSISNSTITVSYPHIFNNRCLNHHHPHIDHKINHQGSSGNVRHSVAAIHWHCRSVHCRPRRLYNQVANHHYF